MTSTRNDMSSHKDMRRRKRNDHEVPDIQIAYMNARQR